MKVIAFILLIICIWDLIKPFHDINNTLRKQGRTWLSLWRLKEFHFYAVAVSVNILAIIFFAVYLGR